VVLPDAVAPFAGSIFRQHQRFDVNESASLMLLDWFYQRPKRRAGSDGRWNRMRRGTRFLLGESGVMIDGLRLNAEGGAAIGSVFKMGRFDCFCDGRSDGAEVEGGQAGCSVGVGECAAGWFAGASWYFRRAR